MSGGFFLPSIFRDQLVHVMFMSLFLIEHGCVNISEMHKLQFMMMLKSTALVFCLFHLNCLGFDQNWDCIPKMVSLPMHVNNLTKNG